MTSNFNYLTQKKKRATVDGSSLLLSVFALFMLLLMLKNAALSIEYIKKGLSICTHTVIPSVFPFMVLSEILIACPIQGGKRSLGAPPCKKLLALPPKGLLVMFLGLLCGFPIGARCAAEAYEQGQLTKKEAERVIAISGNPSPAFLVGAVGFSMRGNRLFGWTLFGCLSLLSLLFALFSARLYKKEYAVYLNSSNKDNQKSAWKILADAIKKAAQGMLTVCAYILFFAAITGCFELVARGFGLSEEIIALSAAFLELSGGANAARHLSAPLLSAAMTAFAAGWSGCCVHCQIFSVCESSALSIKLYLMIKSAQGVLCALLILLLGMLFPDLLSVST